MNFFYSSDSIASSDEQLRLVISSSSKEDFKPTMLIGEEKGQQFTDDYFLYKSEDVPYDILEYLSDAKKINDTENVRSFILFLLHFSLSYFFFNFFFF